MKKSIFLAGILLPVLSYTQIIDSTAHTKLITAAPRLGSVTISNLIAPVKINGNTFTMQLPVADINIPVYKNFSSAHPVLIKTGIRYQGLLLSNEKNIGSANFHSITVPLMFSYSNSHATNITLIGLGSIASDFKRTMKTTDILYTAGIRIGFRQNKSFKYGVTLTYTSNYSGTYLLPIPDIDWAISKKLRLNAVLPARASLVYKISETHTLGVTGGLNVSMYSVNKKTGEQYLHLQQLSGGLIYDLKFNQRWKLNLVAGHTFMQKLELFNRDQKVSFERFNKLNDRTPVTSYDQNSFIFQGGIGYQF